MFLLLGYGYWGKNVARSFGNELCAVCETDTLRHQEIKELYPNAKIYSEYEKALEDDNVVAVIIATKAMTHHKLSLMALRANKHVWIEKPAGITIQEIDDIIRESEKRDLRVFVDHVMCHDPKIAEIKNTVDFGMPVYFESYRLHQGGFQPDVDVIHDLAVHDLSIIDFLFPNQVLKSKQVIKNRHVKGLSDHAVLNMLFESGLRATITCSWISPIKQRQMFIAGTNSLLTYSDGNVEVINEKNAIDADFSADSCYNAMPLTAGASFGLDNARDRFRNGIIKSEPMISDIYQAKRIQTWLE
jgi:predicted dehydrogenase